MTKTPEKPQNTARKRLTEFDKCVEAVASVEVPCLFNCLFYALLCFSYYTMQSR